MHVQVLVDSVLLLLIVITDRPYLKSGINKRERTQKEQSQMDNPETLTT
jgi:hypothetical protein